MQATLLSYVKPRKKVVAVYRFLQDVPEILGPDGKKYGPFKAGDLVGLPDVPLRIWKVLESRNVVKPYHVRW